MTDDPGLRLTDEECDKAYWDVTVCSGPSVARQVFRRIFAAGRDAQRKRDVAIIRLLITTLTWKEATEDEKTLVYGNLRNAIAAIEKEDADAHHSL